MRNKNKRVFARFGLPGRDHRDQSGGGAIGAYDEDLVARVAHPHLRVAVQRGSLSFFFSAFWFGPFGRRSRHRKERIESAQFHRENKEPLFVQSLLREVVLDDGHALVRAGSAQEAAAVTAATRNSTLVVILDSLGVNARARTMTNSIVFRRLWRWHHKTFTGWLLVSQIIVPKFSVTSL